MAPRPAISFAKLATPKKGSVVLFMPEGGALGEAAKACDPGDVLKRTFAISEFTGKFGQAADIIAPHGAPYDRLVVIGLGKPDKLDEFAWFKLGGAVAAQARKPADFTVVIDAPGVKPKPEDVAHLAAGIQLRAYTFDKYKTKKEEADGKPLASAKFALQYADPAGAKEAFADAEAVVEGVFLARDLVNEPANALGPIEIADHAKGLEALGVSVEVLTEKEMKKLGMGALLGVGQGSIRPPRLVIMSWNGGKPKDKPVAFIGKGVV